MNEIKLENKFKIYFNIEIRKIFLLKKKKKKEEIVVHIHSAWVDDIYINKSNDYACVYTNSLFECKTKINSFLNYDRMASKIDKDLAIISTSRIIGEKRLNSWKEYCRRMMFDAIWEKRK